MNTNNESAPPLTIEPVTLDLLETSGRNRKSDPVTAELPAAEREYLRRRRRAFRRTEAQRIFPDQSTADRFFDEVQFEAYRELGHTIGSQMLAHPVVEQDLKI